MKTLDITALMYHMSKKLKNVSSVINYGWTIVIDSPLTVKESAFFVKMGANPFTSITGDFNKKIIINLR